MAVVNQDLASRPNKMRVKDLAPVSSRNIIVFLALGLGLIHCNVTKVSNHKRSGLEEPHLTYPEVKYLRNNSSIYLGSYELPKKNQKLCNEGFELTPFVDFKAPSDVINLKLTGPLAFDLPIQGNQAYFVQPVRNLTADQQVEIFSNDNKNNIVKVTSLESLLVVDYFKVNSKEISAEPLGTQTKVINQFEIKNDEELNLDWKLNGSLTEIVIFANVESQSYRCIVQEMSKDSQDTSVNLSKLPEGLYKLSVSMRQFIELENNWRFLTEEVRVFDVKKI